MLSKTHRFHGYNSLSYVYKHGSTVRGPLFSIKSTLNPKRQSYRVAVVVSRKVHKSAVARNRIRRRLYEAIRALDERITEPHDIVITVFQDSLLNETPSALTWQVKKQLTAAGVLANAKSEANS